MSLKMQTFHYCNEKPCDKEINEFMASENIQTLEHVVQSQSGYYDQSRDGEYVHTTITIWWR